MGRIHGVGTAEEERGKKREIAGGGGERGSRERRNGILEVETSHSGRHKRGSVCDERGGDLGRWALSSSLEKGDDCSASRENEADTMVDLSACRDRNVR